MNKKLNFLLLSLLASIGIFIYLSYHHYMVKLGLSGASLCQISDTINCDVAALSRYAEVAHIPIAVFGLSFSIVLLGIFLFAKLNWLEETPAYKTIVKLLTAGSALYSVFLLSVSVTQLKAFCPFCIAGYVLSFITMGLTWWLYSDTKLNFAGIQTEKGILGSLLAIPFLAWFISGSIRDNYGLDQLEKIIPEKIYLWQNTPVVSFDESVGLIKGSEKLSGPVIVEFADFKCPHCKSAAATLKNFLAANKDVKLIYKPYPLDGVCNPHIPTKGDGTRCELAGWSLCAEKLYGKGWDVHYWIFDHQEELITETNLSLALSHLSKEFNINGDDLKKCATSVETYDILKKTSAEGEVAKITGTPAIFVNGKKLEHGQFIDILQAAINTLR